MRKKVHIDVFFRNHVIEIIENDLRNDKPLNTQDTSMYHFDLVTYTHYYVCLLKPIAAYILRRKSYCRVIVFQHDKIENIENEFTNV